MSMMSAPRNRSIHKVDNPMDSDGFYMYRYFKGSRKNGAPTGKRAWRRALRSKEAVITRRDIADER